MLHLILFRKPTKHTFPRPKQCKSCPATARSCLSHTTTLLKMEINRHHLCRLDSTLLLGYFRISYFFYQQHIGVLFFPLVFFIFKIRILFKVHLLISTNENVIEQLNIDDHIRQHIRTRICIETALPLSLFLSVCLWTIFLFLLLFFLIVISIQVDSLFKCNKEYLLFSDNNNNNRIREDQKLHRIVSIELDSDRRKKTRRTKRGMNRNKIV